jgi:tight adherence protein C
MLSNPGLVTTLVFVCVSLAVGFAGFAAFLRAYGDRRQGIVRLRGLARENASSADEDGAPRAAHLLLSAIPKLGQLLLGGREERAAGLKTRLLHAGYSSDAALRLYVGGQVLLALLFLAIGLIVAYVSSRTSFKVLALSGVAAAAAGMLLPMLWLNKRVNVRQRLLRGALPDALDMLILCVEGGVTLMGALQRITEEMHFIHPLLGAELDVIEKEIKLGLSPGEALKHFGERSGLSEVRELASIILQSERSGASIAKALRTHADCSRAERSERAREKAQKLGVKILFPILLCIFPAIFIVLLGPAAFQIATIFAR